MILAQAPAEVGAGASMLVILVSAAVTNNILLTRFLGMCPFLAVSSHMKSALGLGLAVVFVTTCTSAINSALYWYVLMPLTKYGVPESLKLILFIIVIAGFVQLMEMLIERLSISLYFSLGIFLPLITVNCAILGTSLFMVTGGYRPPEALVFGFGSGSGWMLAIVLMAGIRQRLKSARVPAALEGPGITLIIAGIMSLAFVIFAGMIK
jgi:Na+-transporting NADH:ubiquinone oxidoreductase subunit E